MTKLSWWRASRVAADFLRRTVVSDASSAAKQASDNKSWGASQGFYSRAFASGQSNFGLDQLRAGPVPLPTPAILVAGAAGGGLGYAYRSLEDADGKASFLGQGLSQGLAELTTWRPWRSASAEHNPAVEAASQAASLFRTPFLGPHFIADAAARASPAVVNILVQVGEGPGGRHSGGSGCIIEAEGTILTNAHVVDSVVAEQKRYPGQPSPILVSLADGRMFNAEVKSFDKVSDLAVLEVQTQEPLPVVSLGSSQPLRVGEWVVALGSPLHLSKSVTAGIVSCVDRKAAELGLLGDSSDYIQTDAAVNLGNSGGPLINLAGEVVGISSFKAVAADGVSFAIPIDTAKDVLQQLREHGRVVRPYAGIRMLQLTDHMRRKLQGQDAAFSSVKHGIIVAEVAMGSPAEKAGLKSGDIITGFGSAKDVTTANLIKTLTEHINKPLTLEISRKSGTSCQLQITAREATQPRGSHLWASCLG